MHAPGPEDRGLYDSLQCPDSDLTEGGPVVARGSGRRGPVEVTG